MHLKLHTEQHVKFVNSYGDSAIKLLNSKSGIAPQKPCHDLMFEHSLSVLISNLMEKKL